MWKHLHPRMLCLLLAWNGCANAAQAGGSGIRHPAEDPPRQQEKMDEADQPRPLPVVTVYGGLRHVFRPVHQQQIDQQALQARPFGTMDQVLQSRTAAHIRSYGPGVLATASLRGGAASHTHMLWNGFTLNSPMNGSMDLSLLPSSLFHSASVQYGGGNALWGNGTQGGAIFLDSGFPDTRGFFSRLQAGTGSMGEWNRAAAAGYLNEEGLSAMVRVMRSDNPNRYRYVNSTLPGRPHEIQEMASQSMQGLMTGARWSGRRMQTTQIHFWWQENDRHIPPSLVQSHTGAHQADHAARLTASWQQNRHRSVIQWRGAWFSEGIHYTDSMGLSSQSQWQTLAQQADILWQPRSGWLLMSGVQLRLLNARADEYSQDRQRNELTGLLSLQWAPPEKAFEINMSARQDYTSGHSIPFTPSVRISYRIRPLVNLHLGSGKNARLPSLNDLYWQPGGNPDLLPEKGWSHDVGVEWNQGRMKENDEGRRALGMESIGLTAFYSRITQRIIWLPKGGGMLWSPENLQQVHSHGLEAWAKGHRQAGPLQINYGIRYHATRSINLIASGPNDRSVGKQLIYVPTHRAVVQLSVSFRTMALHYHHGYTGRVFTTSDHSHSLPAWHTGELGVSWQGSLGRLRAEGHLRITNLLNKDYQVMANRPMPLRHVSLGLSLGVAGKDQSLQTK